MAITFPYSGRLVEWSSSIASSYTISGTLTPGDIVIVCLMSSQANSNASINGFVRVPTSSISGASLTTHYKVITSHVSSVNLLFVNTVTTGGALTYTVARGAEVFSTGDFSYDVERQITTPLNSVTIAGAELVKTPGFKNLASGHSSWPGVSGQASYGLSYLENQGSSFILKATTWSSANTAGYIVLTPSYLQMQQSIFSYKGIVQTFVAPYTGVYLLETWGAQGGGMGAGTGGRGGYSKGSVTLTKGQLLNIYVGGTPSGTNAAGWNGGGSSNNASGGGGATDMRTSSTLQSRILVAGGGGGGGSQNASETHSGGHGGGSTGLAGTVGNGGTQSVGGSGDFNGSLGIGGNGSAHGTAGGGGYYGGGGGNSCNRSGGGGSGYIGGVTDGQTLHGGQTMPRSSTGTQVGQSGHGAARITFSLTLYKINKALIDKTRVLSNDQMKLSWEIDTDIAQDMYRANYEIQVNMGSGWIDVVKELEKDIRSYVYVIPIDRSKYNSAMFRIRTVVPENSYTSDWVNSPVFVIDRYGFVIKADDKFYTYRSNNWLEITGEQNKDWFIENGLGDLDAIPTAKWAELVGDVTLISFTNSSHTPVVDVTVPQYKPIYLLEEKDGSLVVKGQSATASAMSLIRTANPNGQLILQKVDYTLHAPTIPEVIKQMTLTGLQVGTATSGRRLMFSVDKGTLWYSWVDGQWKTFIDPSKELVKTNGMTIEEINARSEEEWFIVFGGKPRHLRFAYYLEMDLFNHRLEVDEIELEMDITGSWRKAKSADYTYGYPDDDVLQVKLLKNGAYKINY